MKVIGSETPESWNADRLGAALTMDHRLKDVTVSAFLDALRDAIVRLDVVQPAGLREPLALWFRATVEKATREGWTDLLGRHVVAVWNAARAVLDQAAEPVSR